MNTLRLRQNGRHFAEVIFKCIFLNENVWIGFKILLKFVPKQSDTKPNLVAKILATNFGDRLA